MCAYAGCGEATPSTLPVSGEVVYPDGTSLPLGGTVIFTSVVSDNLPSAKGYFGSDGKFQLTTYSENDGAVPGEFLAAVRPNVPDDRGSMSPREYIQAMEPIDPKFLSPQTSGLRFTVAANQAPPHIHIEVTKPSRRR